MWSTGTKAVVIVRGPPEGSSMLFEEFGLSAQIVRAVEGQGYTTPTPIQEAAIPVVLEGRDVLGCAQTGTGKSAAFALPILHRLTGGGNPPRGSGRRTRVLVLSPTRELALQIGESFETYGEHTGLKTLCIYGGVNQFRQTKGLQHGVDILVATPGRLLDLINQGYVRLTQVQTLVLDEADRMLDMGFMPDIRRIVKLLPEERQTLFFSATMPTAIEALARDILTNPVHIKLTPERPETDLVTQSVYLVQQSKKTSLLIHVLRQPEVARAIVFTRTKYAADRVCRQLQKSGISSDAIHGNKSQNNRQRTLENFRSDVTQVMVATDVAARGIDVDGITHVINYDMPHDPETYVHRIGRTGRANSLGTAFSFCAPGEKSDLKQIERLLRHPIELAPRVEGLESETETERPAREERPQTQERRGKQPRQDKFHPRRELKEVPQPEVIRKERKRDDEGSGPKTARDARTQHKRRLEAEKQEKPTGRSGNKQKKPIGKGPAGKKPAFRDEIPYGRQFRAAKKPAPPKPVSADQPTVRREELRERQAGASHRAAKPHVPVVTAVSAGQGEDTPQMHAQAKRRRRNKFNKNRPATHG